MIIRQWALAWLVGAAAIAATGPASAETTRVELRLSGPTWHAAACPHENPFGTARCHARIVTDARGTPIDGKARANRGGTPNAIPAGYGPADLKSAYAIPAGSGAPVIAIVDAYGYPKAEVRSRGVSRAIWPSGLHDGQRLLQEGQPDRRRPAIRATTSAGSRSRRSTSTWRARRARTARSSSSRRTRRPSPTCGGCQLLPRRSPASARFRTATAGPIPTSMAQYDSRLQRE